LTENSTLIERKNHTKSLIYLRTCIELPLAALISARTSS